MVAGVTLVIFAVVAVAMRALGGVGAAAGITAVLLVLALVDASLDRIFHIEESP